MDIPTIAPEDIARFHELHDEFRSLQDRASDALRTAQLNKEYEITIARDGKAVVMKEGDLWTEVWLAQNVTAARSLISPNPRPISERSRLTPRPIFGPKIGRGVRSP